MVVITMMVVMLVFVMVVVVVDMWIMVVVTMVTSVCPELYISIGWFLILVEAF